MPIFSKDRPTPSIRLSVTSSKGGRSVTGVETFNGIYKLANYKRPADAMWEGIDILMLPTAPTIYRVAEMQASPLALNANLALYTNFVNLLDMAAVAVPAGFRSNGTGFGITFIGPAWTDAARWDGDKARAPPAHDTTKDHRMDTIKLASSAPTSKACRRTGN